MANRTKTHELVLWLLLTAGFITMIAGMGVMNLLISLIGMVTTLVAAAALIHPRGGTR